MNCPVCKELVGVDQFARGPAHGFILDRRGQIIDGVTTLFVSCGHCGETEVDFDFAGHMKSRRGPFKDPRDVRRVLAMLPGNRGRRVPA